MAIFTPPAVADRPPVMESDKMKNILGYKLMRYYHSRVRGVNVFKMSDGTYRRDDANPGEPYPAVLAMPNNALAQSWYNGTMTNFPLPTPYVVTIYYGGHSYQVSAAEATALNAAGYTTT